MRDLVIVIDHKRDDRDRWALFQTTTIRVPEGSAAEATAVREHCTRLGETYRGNGYRDRLRVRSWSGVALNLAFNADAYPPSAEYTYPPIADVAALSDRA